jgi:hypothetical protein
MSIARISKNQNLTRRAKQAHHDIIADIIKPGSGNPEWAYRIQRLIFGGLVSIGQMRRFASNCR